MAEFPIPKHNVIDARGLSLAIDDIFLSDSSGYIPAFFATEEEAIDKTIEDRAISPATLDDVLQERLAYLSLARYSSYDRTNISPALAEAIAEAKAAGGGTIYIPPGDCQAKAKVTVDFDNVHFFSDGDITINLHADIGASQPLFNVPTLASTYSTTVAVDIERDSTEIVVADASGIDAGDYIELFSSGEYWNGIATVGGYRRENKSERVRVKDKSGNTLTLEKATADSYDATNYTVTVYVKPKYKSFGMSNLGFYGIGVLSGTGPRPALLDSIEHLVLKDIDMENFGHGTIQIKDCDFFQVSGGWLRGYDLSDPDEETANYSGYNLVGSTNGLITNLRGTGLRRLMNFDASSGSVIPRILTFANSTTEACLNAVGTHLVDDLAIVNVKGDKGGIYYRGKNPTIIGCSLSSVGLGLTTGTILLGSDAEFPYGEENTVGVVNIQHNRIRTNNSGIAASCSIEGGIIANNYIEGVRYHGMRFRSKRHKNLYITNNKISADRSESSGSAGILFTRNSITPRLEMHDIYMRGNVFEKFPIGIDLYGTDDPNVRAYNIVSDGDTFNDCGVVTMSNLMTASGGFFGENVGIRNARILGTLSSTLVSTPGDASKYSHRFFDDENYYEGTARTRTVLHLTSGTPGSRINFEVGDCYEYSPPIIGLPRRYRCKTAGTMSSGGFPSVTGSMTSGDATLTFNTDPNVSVAAVVSNNCSATTGWTIGSGWAHDGSSKFTHTAASTGNTAALSYAATGLTDGNRYRLKATVVDYVAGNVCGMYVPDDTLAGGNQLINANGDFYLYFTASGTTATIQFLPNTAFAGSITNIVIDEVVDYVFPGTYLSIPGAGVAAATLVAKVVSIIENVAEISTNASTTISGQTITQSVPVFEGIDFTGFASAPASASATGIAGQVAKDTTRYYICSATNTWVRSAEFTTW